MPGQRNLTTCKAGQGLVRTRTLFLRSLALTFAMAFSSLYPQIDGLYGPAGILPIADQKVVQIPVLSSHLLPEARDAMEFLCVSGAILASVSASILPGLLCKFTMAYLWFAYRELFKVGGTFLWFQWDTLLLEVGFLGAVLVAPMRPFSQERCRPRDAVSLMLVRWLLFRMMFASGVVKLQSGCPAWWGLTAMPLHYESQCLPTPLAWVAFNLGPSWIHRLSVVGTYVIEIPMTYLFFAPNLALRKVTFVFQVALMVLITLTGNYNFFNFLYVVLCISLVQDSWLPGSSGSPPGDRNGIRAWVSWLATWAVLLALAQATWALFADPSAVRKANLLTVNFDKAEFESFVTAGVKVGIALGAFSMVWSFAAAVRESVFPSVQDVRLSENGCFSKIWKLCDASLHGALALALFVASLPTFARGVGQSPANVIWPPGLADLALKSPHILRLEEGLNSLQAIHSYGLFRRMTGVGGRPELIVEGSEDGRAWLEYHFRYKPGDVGMAPRFCTFHQPRLDWQMWFAALGDYPHNPWLVSLVYRILQHKESVLKLMDYENNPFKRRPPKYVRVLSYVYHFTDGSPFGKGGNWWFREKAREYLPPLSLDQEDGLNYLKKIGIQLRDDGKAKVSRSKQHIIHSGLKDALAVLRQSVSDLPQHLLTWSLTAISLPFILMTS